MATKKTRGAVGIIITRPARDGAFSGHRSPIADEDQQIEAATAAQEEDESP